MFNKMRVEDPANNNEPQGYYETNYDGLPKVNKIKDAQKNNRSKRYSENT